MCSKPTTPKLNKAKKLSPRVLILNLSIAILKVFLRAIYALLKLLPVRDKVVFISRKNRNTSIDMQLLEDYIQKYFPRYVTRVLNHKTTSPIASAGHIFQQMYHLATAKACIIDSYIIPVSILNHRQSITIVQIWHALGAIKKFGWAALDTEEGSSASIAQAMNMHRNYTYVVAGGPEAIPHFAEAFDVKPETILPIGLPRVDFLLTDTHRETTKKKLLARYPALQNSKPTILYAPTFRKNHETKAQELTDAIDTNSYNLIIKQHYLDKTDYQDRENIIVDKEFEGIELLFIADFLITDYSAIAFEAAALDIPTYFYTYDFDQYQRARGLFFNKEMFPGPLCSDSAEVFERISKKMYDKPRIKEFKQQFVTVRDGTSTEKIISLLGL
jgi:CDP-ribitol ribitolphosphotransferase / teichoic acid ribitol-phosphate polymerase